MWSCDSNSFSEKELDTQEYRKVQELKLHLPQHIQWLQEKLTFRLPGIPVTVAACCEDSVRGPLTTEYVTPVSIKKPTICPPLLVLPKVPGGDLILFIYLFIFSGGDFNKLL